TCYTPSLHDALPICGEWLDARGQRQQMALAQGRQERMTLKNPQDSTFTHGTPRANVGIASILDNTKNPARQWKCQSLRNGTSIRSEEHTSELQSLTN